jgi:hypothetical protein
VSDNEFPVIQNVVAYKTIQEFRDLGTKRKRFPFELFQRIGKAMRNLDVAAAQFAEQFDVVIARDTQSGASIDHTDDQAQNVWNVWPTIDEVAQKNSLSALRRGNGTG